MKTKLVCLTVLLSVFHLQAQPKILLVSDNAYSNSRAGTGDPELEFVAYLQSLGYEVVRATGSGATAQFREGQQGAAGAQAVIDAQGIGLVIISRVIDSGSYDGNTAQWNAITTPTLSLSPHSSRNNRWLWFNTATIVDLAGTDIQNLNFVDPDHPFVAGLATDIYDMPGQFTRIGINNAGNGTVIATDAAGNVALAEWPAGVAFYPGGSQIAGGRRVAFGGHRYHEDDPTGTPIQFELYSENGKALLAQIIRNLLPVSDIAYDEPEGGWAYKFDGDAVAPGTGGYTALDGTWNHDNGSDEWDGSDIGTGRPGGVSALSEGRTTYLRVQDTGNPADYGFADPGSNRKIYFGHDLATEGTSGTFLNDGVTLSFRAKVATGAPLDMAHPDDASGIVAWPAGGAGYLVHDGGKDNISIRQSGLGVISFSMALPTTPRSDGTPFGTTALVMNSLNGTAASGTVDAYQNEGTLNSLPMDDLTEDWHEFWMTIRADTSGGGSHRVEVYADGSESPTTFHVTMGSGNDFGSASYIAFGAGATPQIGAWDLDFIAYKPGIHEPRAASGGTRINIPADQPADLVVNENDAATLTVEATGTPPRMIQWYRDGVLIDGATSASYTIAQAKYPDDNGATFYVVASNPLGTITTRTATLTVIEDTVPPFIVSASTADGRHIGVQLNERVRAVPEEFPPVLDPFGWEVFVNGNQIFLQNVELRPDQSSVILTLPEASNIEGAFEVACAELVDLALNTTVGSSASGTRWLEDVVDIGGPLPAGKHLSTEVGKLEIEAGGADIWGTIDQGTFAYRTVSGNFDVQVRIDSLAFVGNAWSKAGLNVRSSLDAGAQTLAWIYPTPTQGANAVEYARRAADNAGVVDVGQPRPAVNAFPVWVRVRRVGSVVSAFFSRDGSAWAPVGVELQNEPAFPNQLLVGVAVTSHIQGTATIAKLSQFQDVDAYPDAVITLTGPDDVMAIQNESATFTVAASVVGAPLDSLLYEWEKETAAGSGVYEPIPSASGASYTIGLVSLEDHGKRFRVEVSAGGSNPVLSRGALLSVEPDTTAPSLTSAIPDAVFQTFIVEYSEPVDDSIALDPIAYEVKDSAGNEVLVLRIEKSASDPLGRTYVIVTRGYEADTDYDVTALGGVDTAGNEIPPEGSTVSTHSFALSLGFARREFYMNIGGGVAVNDLRAAATYPNSPDVVDYNTLLEGPVNAFNNYGERISGFLRPTASDAYDFFMASDDGGEFWLSTDRSPANLRLVATEPTWNASRDWLGTARRDVALPQNRSTSTPGLENGVPLEAGELYYFEALMKEGGGGDNLAVAATPHGENPPLNGSSPITGAFELVIGADPDGASVQIVQQPQDAIIGLDCDEASSILADIDFTDDGAGFTVENSPFVESGWLHDAETDSWKVNGSASVGSPTHSILKSTVLTLTQPGSADVVTRHRYSFEFGGGIRWDGGQIRVSVNGGPFMAVPASAFRVNGYPAGTVGGNNALNGQQAFTGTSQGYGSGSFLESIFRLNNLTAGTTIQVQYLGAWDEFDRGTLPNWEITNLRLVQGAGSGGDGGGSGAETAYAPPSTGWAYSYSADAINGLGVCRPTTVLDGTWNANNGSSEFDGSLRGAGVGAQGGISMLDGILTVEDINLGSGACNNRKIYFTHDVTQELDAAMAGNFVDAGVTISFRARLTQPDILPAAEIPLPDGWGIFSAGKGHFSVRQSNPSAIVSFSLVRQSEPDNSFNFPAAGLTMNRLNGDVVRGNEVNSTANVAENAVLPLDPNAFHEFWITIQANDATPGNGTHTVNIYVDGGTTPQTFNVTAGNGNEGAALNMIAFGMNNSGGSSALDVDFFSYQAGVHAPKPAGGFTPPTGGWSYIYDGDQIDGLGVCRPTSVLDGTWNANNGSSEFDGSLRGAGNGLPGGISSDGEALTIEDINLGSGACNNRKIYFTHDLTQELGAAEAGNILDTGVTLTFRSRLTQPDIVPAAEIPLPDGWGIFSAGKGHFSVRQSNPSAIISFSLVRQAEPDNSFNFSSAGLTMNRLNGDVVRGNEVNSTANVADNPLLALDPNEYHDFWITIQANDATPGNGTHTVNIYMDGSTTPQSFNVTAGNGNEGAALNMIAMGLNNSGGQSAVDIDYFGYKAGVHPPGTGGGEAGTPVTFSVGAAAQITGNNNAPIFVQWQRDGDDIPGANGLTYELSATAEDVGAQFSAKVYTPGASAVSDSATVVLNLAPTVQIIDPADGATLPSLTPLTVRAAAVDPGGSVFQVEFFAEGVGSLGVDMNGNDGWSVTIPQAPPGIYILNAVATDNLGTPCSSGTVMVTVTDNTPPIAIDDTIQAFEDVVLVAPAGTVLINDVDAEGDPLTASLVSQTAFGTVNLNPDGGFTYTPALNFNGIDSFRYLVNDGKVDSALPATVTINVMPVNDAPVCTDVAATADEDAPVAIALPATDVDHPELDLAIVSGPSNGSVSLIGNVATYLGNPDFNGADSFTFQATDAAGALSGICTATVTVRPVNDAPVAVMTISPTIDMGDGVTGIQVLAASDLGACVTLDGTQSSDIDSPLASLTYLWLVNDVPVGTGAVLADVCLPVGSPVVTLVVSDGAAEGERDEVVQVITAAEATEELILQVNDATIDRKTKQQFIATLKNAVAALERGSTGAGLNMLEAFINKTDAQLDDNPDVQAEWIRIAEAIVEGSSTPQTCEGCAE